MAVSDRSGLMADRIGSPGRKRVASIPASPGEGAVAWMSREGAPRSNVVDLRRWREERDRRLRAASGGPEDVARPRGDRFRAALDRRLHPVPILSGISAFVLTLGLWGGP